MRFILASSSPRRRDLLQEAGFDFEVRPALLEEVRGPNEVPEEFARRAAREKTLHVAQSAPPGTFVLGADTIVLAAGEVLGKPRNLEDAKRMLRRLSGVTHSVVTAVCLVRAPHELKALEHETTFVTFRSLEDQEIEAYVLTGEPFDKAGAYGVQGAASKFVARIEGDYSNVVGLPMPLVRELLKYSSPDHSKL